MNDETPLYIEWINDDGEPITWFVIATDEQRAIAQAWLDESHADDLPYMGRVSPVTFEEFKRDVMDED
jgi:hypothetical protein